jgi:glycosyltransferase involved in cell wall biosynthesis
MHYRINGLIDGSSTIDDMGCATGAYAADPVPPRHTIRQMKVWITTAYYAPGYKSGGPVRSLSSLVNRLGSEVRFKIITSDRDYGDSVPYPGIATDTWHSVGNAEVLYLSPKNTTPGGLRSVLRPAKEDLLYLNSLFSPIFTIRPLLLRRFGWIPEGRLLVAPRGELCAGALSLKPHKKHAYLGFARAVRLYHNALWHATSEEEAADIRRCFGTDAEVMVAPNLTELDQQNSSTLLNQRKTAGSLRLVFLSRISRKKNLLGALELLHGIAGDVHFTIYGPDEDPDYWQQCETEIRRLPPNIKVHYRGTIPPDQVVPALCQNHVFMLPTLGENFGHVIIEALTAGCPVLLSDQTPWRGLEEKGVGWDLPLDQPQRFREALQRCVDMDEPAYRAWSERARAYGLQHARDETTVDRNRALFLQAT